MSDSQLTAAAQPSRPLDLLTDSLAGRPPMRWHKLYYLLAAFDLLTVLASLCLTHKLMGIYHESVATNQVWADRLGHYSELGQLAVALNGPGNDVFDSRDVRGESVRLEKLRRQFDQMFRSARDELVSNVHSSHTVELLAQFDALSTAIREMTAEAQSIFTHFDRNQPDEAGKHMASMDRKLAEANTSLAAVNRRVRELQKQCFDEQLVAAGHWRMVEFVIAGLVGLMLIGALVYGGRLSRRIEAAEGETRAQAAAVRSREAYIRRVFETAADGIIVCNEWGVIESFNPAAATLFGHTERQAIAKKLHDLFVPQPEDHVSLDALLRAAEAEGRTSTSEIEGRRREGSTFSAELVLTAAQWGDGLKFTAVVRDVGLRKQAEEKLRMARDAAEAANRSKSQFLANMSHEIRTPLNGILGFAELLLRDAEGQDVEQRKEFLGIIQNSGKHLLMLINDILDLSKIEAQQLEVESVRTSPQKVIADVVSVLRAKAVERGLTLEQYWSGEVPQAITTDPQRLRQLLTNLVGNAIKFTEKGSVRIVSRIVYRQDKPWLVIDVVDTGIGIAPENVGRIFDPFVQADSSITRRFGGTGLGLAICKRLAEALGGEISVQSGIGRGSTFTVTIDPGALEAVDFVIEPVADAMATPRSDAPSAISFDGARVLLVEDGSTNRQLISLVLSRAGAKVIEAENGQVGVQAATAAPFDLVLMDMQMPIMDGYQASAELRQRGYQQPIIALTANAMKGDQEKCLAAGCSDYLSKPVDINLLLCKVGEALGRNKSDSASQTFAANVDVAQSKSKSSALTSPILPKFPFDDPAFHEIAGEFAASLPCRMAAIRDAWDQRDFTRLREEAHWLKGAGGTAGFADFTSPSGSLEAAARDQQLDHIEQLVSDLSELSQRIAVSPTETRRVLVP